MAKYSRVYLAGLAAGYIRYIPLEPDGSPLLECHPSDWIDVYIGIYSLSNS